MKMLHELLAVEKTRNEAAETLLRETDDKFGKAHYFQGYEKTLNMLADSPENTMAENAARQQKALPTTVCETLEYALDIWAEAEDIQFQKNITNTQALADLILSDGSVIASGLPVDELMGLEVRLGKIKSVILRIPTVDAALVWELDKERGKYIYRSKVPTVTTKTEKKMYAVVLHPATKEHPAQVREAAKDEVVGTFTQIDWSGAATAMQKSEVIKRIDDLIAATKSARMRANKTEVVERKIGKAIAELILEPLKQI